MLKSTIYSLSDRGGGFNPYTIERVKVVSFKIETGQIGWEWPEVRLNAYSVLNPLLKGIGLIS